MIFELTERKNTKHIVRIIVILLGLVLIISSIWVNYLLILLGLYIIAMGFLIKVRTIQVYQDRFELHGKSILPILNSREIFPYSKIKNIEFDESYNDVLKSTLKSFSINAISMSGSTIGTYSKPDTIKVINTDESFRVINKIGNKKQFMESFGHILKQINTTQNKK